jgi:hypothetical protein
MQQSVCIAVQALKSGLALTEFRQPIGTRQFN